MDSPFYWARSITHCADRGLRYLMPSLVRLYGILPRRTSLNAVETGLLGFTLSVSGGAPLLSCLARFVTTLTRENFESTCRSRPSRSPNTESLTLAVFQFFESGVGDAMDAVPFGPHDRREVVDRLVRLSFLVDHEIIEPPSEGELVVRDFQPRGDLFVRLGAPRLEARAEIRELVGDDEDEDRVGKLFLDGERAVDFGLRDDVVAVAQLL